MLEYAEINILDITVEHLDNTIEHMKWLSHSWTSIFLRAYTAWNFTQIFKRIFFLWVRGYNDILTD